MAVVVASLVTILSVPQVSPTQAAGAGCAPSPSGAADLNDAFSRPGLGATDQQEGFGGGDYQHAYALPDGRVLWLFQDLHFSNDEQLGVTEAAHNAGLIQSGTCFEILGARGQDVAGDALTVDSRRWFWPMDGEIGRDGALWVFFAEMENPNGNGAAAGARPVATWLARFDPATLAVESFEPAPDSTARLFGWSVASDDQWTYLYGYCDRQFVNGDGALAGFDASCTPNTYLARVPLGDFLATPTYWSGSGWSAASGAAVPVSSRATANPMSVAWFGDTWVSVTKIDDWWGASLFIDRASSPAGPWQTVQTIDTVGMRRCSDCGNYAAFLMPGLDANGAMTVALSNGAPYDLWRANASLYRPSFLSVAVPTAATPLAAASAPEFPTPKGNAGFVAVDPVRLVDTRAATSPVPRPVPGSVTRLDLRALAPAGTTAVALNLTSSRSQDGYITAYPCSAAVPSTSNLNPAAGHDVTNAAILPLGDGEICFWSNTDTDLLVDLNGWLTTGATAGLQPVTPRRLVDTRSGIGGSSRLAADETIVVQAVAPGSPATAVQLDLTAVDPGADGFVTAWPCGTSLPVVSNLNPSAGVTRPNLANVRVDAQGRVCIYTKQPTDLLVDVLAEYRPGAPARFAPISPQRVLDTRSEPRPAHAGQAVVVALGSLTAAQVNVTVTGAAGAGYATVYPCLSSPLPTASNLNFGPAESTANTGVMQPGRGYGCVWTSAAAGVVVDVFGVWS
jgi:hypothetical protein